MTQVTQNPLMVHFNEGNPRSVRVLRLGGHAAGSEAANCVHVLGSGFGSDPRSGPPWFRSLRELLQERVLRNLTGGTK